MKVFMIGGTGLLGSQAAKELIERGHEVTSIALPPLPEGAVLPPEMKIEYDPRSLQGYGRICVRRRCR